MNDLARETSPYLLQHGDNPVHWKTWNSESLTLAREQDKPILLSIGYSACHWCHVMAHESFEDQATADLMNRLFINVKVDREERPDLDKIYQATHSILNQRAGGWPLTAFLDPQDHMPIFVGTYFPREARHGLPSFSQLLNHINKLYRTRRQDIKNQSDAVREILDRARSSTPGHEIPDSIVLDVARRQIEQQYDATHGGFSPAPKFLHPTILERCLRHWYASSHGDSSDTAALEMANHSLLRMATGGVFDQLGGGFFRYSTDERWMIPHFEKMLYDNGTMLSLLTQIWSITGDETFSTAAHLSARWVCREMQDEDGGYLSALDADTEDREGRYYVWDQGQIDSATDGKNLDIVRQHFGLNDAPNFEDRWHLHAEQSITETAAVMGLDETIARSSLHEARRSLYEARLERTNPGLDDKILTGWNGLMIAGMAEAGRTLAEDAYIESAVRAARHLYRTVWSKDRLTASVSRNGKQLNGYLDDHAFLLYGLLELLRARWDSGLLEWAVQIAEALLDRFYDASAGGFFFTSHDHEELIQRSLTFSDEAIPSGNGIAAIALLRLGYLTGNTRYIDSVDSCLRAAAPGMNENAISHCSMMTALSEYLTPPEVIIVRCTRDNADKWRSLNVGRYLPETHLYVIDEGEDLDEHGLLASRVMTASDTVYRCDGMQCSRPHHSYEDLERLLEARSSTR